MPSTWRNKLMWLIAARVAVITLILGSAILIQVRSNSRMPVDPFFFILGLTYALTAFYSLALKTTERHRWLIDVQLGCDAVIVSAIVLLTGGVTSYFSSLYTLPIIAASAIESRRGGLVAGVLGSVMYAGLVLVQYFGWASLPEAFMMAPHELPVLRVALFTVSLNVFGFLAVAGLSGYLAEGLRQTGERLERTSNQLADLQAFSQHIIDSLRSGLATTDIEGRILTFNRAAETITGVPAAEAVGMSASEILQLPKDCAQLFGVREERPRLPRLEFGFARADLRSIELGLSTAPLVTPRGETGFLFTFQDVTEARKQEREARVQQRLAAVGEMAAGIAHEIRNPLASMSGSMQILRQELPLTADQSALMDIVLRESDRLNETIKSFLAYARPERQTATMMDVRQVITDASTLLQNSSERHDTHQISVDVPAEPVWCLAGEGQIRQIIWNLASNGLRAMPGGGRLTLSVASVEAEEDRPGEVLIAVRDEGVGIPPDELEGVLQPFRGSFERGTGLGLSIVHKIVSDYGGQLQVNSTRGEGTTVVVKLPLATTAVNATIEG